MLAALAVLDRPDVFHAAVAGAPVTDWALYDTAYSERYLGLPDGSDAYELTSLLPRAPRLTRPLVLIHGLADDNVLAAHTLLLLPGPRTAKAAQTDFDRFQAKVAKQKARKPSAGKAAPAKAAKAKAVKA